MADPAARRTMGPVVVLGLVGAGLAAMAGNEAWATGRRCTAAPGIATDSPATTAVALALLAAWGVLLVTRGRVRRAASLLAVALAIGLVATVVLGLDAAKDNLRGGQGGGLLGCEAAQSTGWFWAAVVALPLAVLPALAAVRFVTSWPEMGRRYDAPADAAPASPPPAEERENLDLWKAMDEGHDPTA
ncbi:Trp biosynthesis-associated membrane protein [Nocardioides halotolerans]|uniref:Trp biosynthesis-associated membrane protein n=1 Tax=Nocardioides halotolerans TaxID=433660 RepID=UPI00040EC6EE|nr:Trp biosynthesis-associated membrane protein [Nocardioides halotolerans]